MAITTTDRRAVLCLCSGGCFRELCLAGLPCPHIYKRFQACCLVLAHKDRHFMALIKWSVADKRYMKSYVGVIKQSMLEL